jgi:hypothetical protein
MTPRAARISSRARTTRVLLLLLVGAPAVRATGERPFDVESPLPLPAKMVELEVAATGALDTARVLFPGEEGDQIVVPVVGARVGLGDRGEVRIEGDAWQRFEGDGSASGPGDWTVATKIRFGSSTARVRFAGIARMKIPVASDAEGLGTNLADVDLVAVAGIQVGAIDVDANLGLAILGAPFRERAQIDLLTYALCVRGEPRPGLAVGIELAGREGGDFFPARSVARAGLRWERTRIRWDVAMGIGLADGSPGLELRAGATFLLPGRPAPAASGSPPAANQWTGSRNGP